MAKGQLRVRVVGDDSHLQRTLKGSGGLVGMFAKGVVGASVAVAGGAAFAVKKFADFDAAMTASTAIMGDLSDAMRKDMSDAAREVAKTTKFSAVEAAESYFFLASAGLDAKESIEALPRVAAFAQAGNFDMARATDLLTDAQSALGLAVDDSAKNIENMVRVSDVLVKANTLANASVEEFSEALTNKAGAALNQLNKDVEEGVAVLAVYADQGRKGSDAGTMLNATLEGLTRTAREQAGAYEALGVNVFDSSGEMRNMADIVGDLERAFGGMTVEQQLAELASLGLTRQARDGIIALLGNADAIREYEDALRDAGGTTDEVAEKQLQTFWAQLGLLKDQLIDVALEVGETLMPHLMNLVSWAQDNAPEIGDRIVGAFQAVVGFIEDPLIPTFRAMKKWWDDNGGRIIKAVTDVKDAVVAFANTVRRLWGDVVSSINKNSRDWRRIHDDITRSVQGLGRSIDSIMQSINRVLGRNSESHVDWGGVVERVIRFGVEHWAGFLRNVEMIVSGVASALDFLSRTYVTVSHLWDNRTKVMRDAVGRLRNAVRDGVDQIVKFFRELPGRIVAAIGDLGSTLVNSGRKLIKGLVTGALEEIKGVGSTIGNALGGAFRRAFSFIPGMGDGEGIPGTGSVQGWQKQWGAIQGFGIRGLRLTSGLRPGARTLSGNLSWHARGRAIDVAGPPGAMARLSQMIAATFGRNTKELIYSGSGGVNLLNGRPHQYSAGVRRQHFDHVHWAMRHGGIVQGGRGGVSALIGEGQRSELVAPLPDGFDVRDLGRDGTHITIHVHGSVVTEHELTEVVRRGLSKTERRNVTVALK